MKIDKIYKKLFLTYNLLFFVILLVLFCITACYSAYYLELYYMKFTNTDFSNILEFVIILIVSVVIYSVTNYKIASFSKADKQKEIQLVKEKNKNIKRAWEKEISLGNIPFWIVWIIPILIFIFIEDCRGIAFLIIPFLLSFSMFVWTWVDFKKNKKMIFEKKDCIFVCLGIIFAIVMFILCFINHKILLFPYSSPAPILIYYMFYILISNFVINLYTFIKNRINGKDS